MTLQVHKYNSRFNKKINKCVLCKMTWNSRKGGKMILVTRRFILERPYQAVCVRGYKDEYGTKNYFKEERKFKMKWNEWNCLLDLGCNQFSDSYIKLLLSLRVWFHSCGALNKAQSRNLPLHQKVKAAVITSWHSLKVFSRQPNSSTKAVSV